jgi:hypothetical protein
MRLTHRLAALETIWPTPDQMVTEGDVGSLGCWSSPSAIGELWDWSGLRAHLRYQSEVDGGWWQLSREQRDERVQFEVDEFCRLLTLLGEPEGFEAWHAQAAHWRGQHGPCDQATFEKRLRDRWRSADASRGHPSSWLFRQTWPEWTPGMSDDDHLRFDLLLSREREARLTPFFPPKE